MHPEPFTFCLPDKTLTTQVARCRDALHFIKTIGVDTTIDVIKLFRVMRTLQVRENNGKVEITNTIALTTAKQQTAVVPVPMQPTPEVIDFVNYNYSDATFLTIICRLAELGAFRAPIRVLRQGHTAEQLESVYDIRVDETAENNTFTIQ